MVINGIKFFNLAQVGITVSLPIGYGFQHYSRLKLNYRFVSP